MQFLNLAFSMFLQRPLLKRLISLLLSSYKRTFFSIANFCFAKSFFHIIYISLTSWLLVTSLCSPQPVSIPIQYGFYTSAMHDAVILYSLAVNQTLSEGGDILDGLNMTKKMWNTTFRGNVHINLHSGYKKQANKFLIWESKSF